MFTSMPTHPDYGQILQAVSEADDQVLGFPGPSNRDEAETQLLAIHAGLVDAESLAAVAMTRAVCVLCDMRPTEFLADPVAALAALYTDAFLTGIRFQKSGGTTAS